MVSEKERERLAPGARSVLVCPNGRDPSAVLPDSPEPTVAFVATMGWAPNVDAAVWLGREIWPAVLARVPEARLLLVGKDPAPAVLALAGDHIEVTGTVDDVGPYLARARVVVAPLRAGGGTRLKVMEALDVGRPLVGTSVGCEGMEDLIGRGVVVADTAPALAETIADLLLDPARAAALGRAGHDAVVADHTWDAALGAADRGGPSVLIALGGIVGLVAAALIVSLFVRWEREGKEQLVPLVLLGLLVVEATIYGDPNVHPAEHLSPRFGLDAAPAARDLHHARADRPAHRAGTTEADRISRGPVVGLRSLDGRGLD